MDEKILIIEDDEKILRLLQRALNYEGYNVVLATEGKSGLSLTQDQKPALIILDWMLPDMDGLEVCSKLNRMTTAPILMLTAKDQVEDKIKGFDSGADDYIVKPFSPQEVMARVRAVLRRLSKETIKQKKSLLQIDNLVIDIDDYIVTINSNKVMLTKKELELLWTLASSIGKVFTRDNLLNILWGYDYYGDTRTVDTHVKRLRAKLNEYPHDKWDVITIWAVGYKFEEKNEK